MGFAMNEPTIICPNCKSEIKLTESLAAPLIETTRLQYEHAIAEKEAEIARREAAIDEQKGARDTIDEKISQKLKAAREKIIAEETKKARLIFETDIEQKAKEVADLQAVLKDRDIRLAEAQKAQVDTYCASSASWMMPRESWTLRWKGRSKNRCPQFEIKPSKMLKSR